MEPEAGRGPALDLRGVSKQFGAIPALTDVSVAFEPGEIHAVCGENGAGKSTLVKLVTGFYTPSQGSISLFGKPVKLKGPRHAQSLGIAVVAQELSLCPDLSLFDNIWLGSLRVPLFHRAADLAAQATKVLDTLGLGHLELSTKAGCLRLGERQLVEIARALARDAQIIVLDEPTATLSDTEIEKLFAALRSLRRDGRTIVYISHRLNEVFALCDQVTVLRNGKLVTTCPATHLTREALIEMMLGHRLETMYPAPLATSGETDVSIRNLSIPGRAENVSIDAQCGTITCIAGQTGSGASEVIAALAGLVYDASGAVRIGSRSVPFGSAAAMQKQGIVLVSGDRAKDGIFLDLSVKDNLVATSLGRYSWCGFLDGRKLTRFAKEVCRLTRIDPGRLRSIARELSGGNQQKLAFGRHIGRDGPGILLMNEPTRGVDVGARGEIYKLMRDFCARGYALILMSSDLEEIIGLGDVIVTMYRGKVAGRYARGDVTLNRVLSDITNANIDPGPMGAPA